MIDQPSQRDFSHLTPNQLSIVREFISTAEPETFNGIDLFEKVLAASRGHTVACHSYSHIPFDFEGVDGGIVSQELTCFNRALARFNLSTDTFVFPENTEKYHSEVLAQGYRKIRVPAANLFQNRYLYLATLALVPPPHCIETEMETGLVRHHGSMLFSDAGRPHRIPLLNRRVALGLKNVVKKGSTLHIWAHPFNFAESDALLECFKAMLHELAKFRDQGSLEFRIM